MIYSIIVECYNLLMKKVLYLVVLIKQILMEKFGIMMGIINKYYNLKVKKTK